MMTKLVRRRVIAPLENNVVTDLRLRRQARAYDWRATMRHQ